MIARRASIEKGKQVGRRWSFVRDGKRVWSSVAVQKVGERFRVFVDEILDENIPSETFEVDLLKSFDSLEEAERFLLSKTGLRLEDLGPLKGQKIFNPALPDFEE
jgi:hypothetical protein